MLVYQKVSPTKRENPGSSGFPIRKSPNSRPLQEALQRRLVGGKDGPAEATSDGEIDEKKSTQSTKPGLVNIQKTMENHHV
jgi:hypothetical protein